MTGFIFVHILKFKEIGKHLYIEGARKKEEEKKNAEKAAEGVAKEESKIESDSSS
jgi:hypothetical protein